MRMPKNVEVAEVCPRDGWQNHPVPIPAETKIKYIKRMADCGVKKMEVTSFVNPKYVPQMGDAKEVAQAVLPYLEQKSVTGTALALNKHGVDDARAAGFRHVIFDLTASEEHNLRNSRRTIQESMDGFKALAREAGDLDIVLAIPCAFGSPFGDEVTLDRLKWLIDEAEGVGVAEFGVADTAGISSPEHTREILEGLKNYTSMDKISLHMHDTCGMGLAGVYAALEAGVTKFESALGGLGGCPFAPGAKGNIATEDLVYMLRDMGIETGLDLEALNAAARDMAAEIQANLASCQSGLCKH